MIFDFVACQDATGMMLGHSLNAGGRRLRKGHWLTEDDVALLTDAHVTQVFAGYLEDGDIPENDAAEEIATIVSGEHIGREAPHTGRCNLVAARNGVLVYDRERLIALNQLDQKITLAMADPFSAVTAGELIGTVKIIPFAVQRTRLDAAKALLAAGPLAKVAPFLKSECALLETRLSAVKPLPQKVIDLTKARAARLDMSINQIDHCNHDPAAVSDWIKRIGATLPPHSILLLFGASATVDEADVIPAAITRSGGTLERVGMAADPGNLLVYGRLNGRHIIGLPGCAKSPALNGFDWVLERVAAGLDITPRDWAEMSVGGLLKEIKARPQLRQPPAKTPPETTE